MRGVLMTQRRRGGFGQTLHAQKPDCQLAAQGATNATIEISLDRLDSAERSRRPLPCLS